MTDREPRFPLTPVARGGLTDRVIDVLRGRIADGTWRLHERLPVEAALAKDLGVGRSTVREAVRVLVHAGLLEVRQGDGTFVRSRREIDAALRRRVLAADLLEVYQVRRGLEVEVARLAALRRRDADVDRLRELATHRTEAYDRSWTEYRTADAALREHLLDMAGNGLLADLYRGVVEPLRSSGTFDDAELTRDDAELHRLVRAVADRAPDDAAAAAGRAADHALRVLRLLLQVADLGR